MTRHHRTLHPIAVARRATQRRLEGEDEAGFTLMEMIVTIAILPIVVGAIAVALLSVFSLQGTVSSRVTDSNDALVASAYFNKDVQSAEQMTTSPSVSCGPTPAPANPAQTQLLGLEWSANVSSPTGYDNVISYVSVPVVSPTGTTTYKMLRQVCTYASGSALTLTSTITVAQDIGSAPVLTITGANNADVTSSFAPSSTNPSGWKSAQGVTGVTFHISEPASGFTYTLTGLPGESTSQGSVSNLTSAGGAGCGFAASGSGFYANSLCFADFTGLNNPPTQYSASNPNQCQTMTRPITNTPYTLSFCLALSGTNVAPAPIPTYYSPGGDNSEAYLGNNGFYTGIPGKPALYQTGGGITTAYFTNIQVLDAAGQPATGWILVTGDAESTDANEWMVFQSNLKWSILPNSGSSANLWGNSCYDNTRSGNNGALQYTGAMPPSDATVASSTAPLSIDASNNFSTGVSTILCSESTQLNKTGTMMLAASEPSGSFAPQTLTVSMRGAGLEALFLGVRI